MKKDIEMINYLYYGDNLQVMRHKIKKESVDLIYLDPPFNSNRNYNIMYRTMTGQPVPEQIEAFCDTWTLDEETEKTLEKMPIIFEQHGINGEFAKFWYHWIEALRHTQPKLLAYLVYMTVRLLEMRSILKPTGSIYLHCDPTASHYIKVMMDGVFGYKNFRNEIIWYYENGGGRAKRWFNKKHDVLLWYSKNYQGWHYFINSIRVPYKKTSAYAKYGTTHHNTGKFYKPDTTVGKNPDDVWNIGILNISAKERLGYPTQKPIALIDRIIKASCPEGGVVFDPFCGCGTTVCSAHLNRRNWIGCDIAVLSIKLIQKILNDRYGLIENTHFETDGIPTSVGGATVLFKKDPYQFQHWCIEHVGGFCNNRKGADKGIDGRIYFKDAGKLSQMILQVKGGKTGVRDIRDLRGVMEREANYANSAKMAGLICLQKPTRPMIEEAIKAGYYHIEDKQYRKMQILSVKEMLEDNKLFDTPNTIGYKEKTNQLKLAF